MDPTLVYRSMVLGIANNSTVQQIVTQRAWRFAKRFIAGSTVDEALEAIDTLEHEGIHGILDLLGEAVTSERQVEHYTEQIDREIIAFGAKPYLRYVSIKLTQIGLDIGFDRMLHAARALAEQARKQDCFVRIDMEDSSRIEKTLEAFRTLRDEGFDNVGLVLQSYLRRSAQDLQQLLPLCPNLRIVKGAYKESASAAFQAKGDVDAGFMALVRTNLSAGNPTAIATHDERMIDHLKAWIQREGIDPAIVEFQLLFGIRRDLQRQLAAEGLRVRVYVPFGTAWYPYFSRRIAERPENALFIAKALLQG